MGDVVRMNQALDIRLDRTELSELEARFGQRRWREIMQDACFDIIERVTCLEIAAASGHHAEVRRLARRIAAIADEVGMTALGRAGHAAAEAAACGDAVARAATLQRLLRAADASLGAVLDAASGEPF